MVIDTIGKTETTTYINIDQVKPNPYQPKSRIRVDDKTSEWYGNSILHQGLIMTPVVRQVSGELMTTYEMCDGWLRLAGFRWLSNHGHTEYNQLPVIIRELTNQQMADAVMTANTTRTDLNIIEKAEAYKLYLDEFKITQSELAQKHDLSQSEIANTIRLLDLPTAVQTMVISREISESIARTLLQLKDTPDKLTSMARRAAANNLTVVILDTEIKAMLGREKRSNKTQPAVTAIQEQLTTDVITPPAQTQPPLIAENPVPAGENQQGAEELPLLNKEPEQQVSPPAITPPVETPSESKDKPTNTETASKPTPSPLNPASPPKWKRKLVLEETDKGVSIQIMSEKGFIINKLDGHLEIILEQLPGILDEANKKWEAK